jgi:hypothetical protein
MAGVAVFLAAGGKHDRRKENYNDDWDNEERGSNAHDGWLLA